MEANKDVLLPATVTGADSVGITVESPPPSSSKSRRRQLNPVSLQWRNLRFTIPVKKGKEVR